MDATDPGESPAAGPDPEGNGEGNPPLRRPRDRRSRRRVSRPIWPENEPFLPVDPYKDGPDPFGGRPDPLSAGGHTGRGRRAPTRREPSDPTGPADDVDSVIVPDHLAGQAHVTESSAPTATGPTEAGRSGEEQASTQDTGGVELVPDPRTEHRPLADGPVLPGPAGGDRGRRPIGPAGQAGPAAADPRAGAEGVPWGDAAPWVRWLRGAAALIALAVLLVTAVDVMRPALDAPTNGDERYTYLDSAVRSAGSVQDSAERAWDTFSYFLDTARPRLFGYGTMFVTYTTGMNYSVEHGVPVWLVQARFKIILLSAGVLALLAFVRSLRGRLPDGGVVAPPVRTVVLVGGTVAAGVAAGCQTQDQYRNAWTAYPLLTYSAVFVVLGVVAFTLMAARLLAERGWWALGLPVLVLVPLSVWLNLTFEMYYIAYPVAMLALLLQPITRLGRWSPARARLVLGGIFTVAFVPLFVWIRIYINDACAVNSCYIGAKMQLGEGVVTSSWLNLVSSGPFDRDEHVRSYLDSIGWKAAIPDGVPGPVVSTAVLLALALLALRLVGGPPGSDTVPGTRPGPVRRLLDGRVGPARPAGRVLAAVLRGTGRATTRPDTGQSGAGGSADPPDAGDGPETGEGPDAGDGAGDAGEGPGSTVPGSAGTAVPVTLDGVHRAQAAALLRGAAVAAAAAVGSAVVMALSIQAQDLIRSVGDLYRNTVFTWVALCTVAALLLVAADLWLRSVPQRRSGSGARWACGGAAAAIWVAVGALVAFTVTQTYPTNDVMTRAVRDSPMARYPDLIYDEVTYGDLSSEGRERRCELLKDMRKDGLWFGERMRLGGFADGGFRLYHSEPFCLHPVEWREASQVWAIRMQAYELRQQQRQRAWQEGRPNATEGTGTSGGAGGQDTGGG